MNHEMEEQVDAVFPVQGPVYCETCHWYAPPQVLLRGFVYPRCRAPGALMTVRTWERVSVVRLQPCERNKHNNCPEWRRRTALEVLGPLVILIGAFCGLLAVVWRLLLR
jgi:hypothetical protein